jgi:hypothetical protein
MTTKPSPTVDQFAKGLVNKFGFAVALSAVHNANPDKHDLNQPSLDGVTPPVTPTIHTRNRTDAELARDHGIQTGQAHVDPAWVKAAVEAFHHCAQRSPDFTTDEVWGRLQDQGIPRPHDGRAIVGPRSKAIKSQWIVPTGETRRSERTKAHAGPKAIYRSLIYAPFASGL